MMLIEPRNHEDIIGTKNVQDGDEHSNLNLIQEKWQRSETKLGTPHAFWVVAQRY